MSETAKNYYCDKCEKEIISPTSYWIIDNHRYCQECYNLHFSIEAQLKNKNAKITDLEAKLAESEKENNDILQSYEYQFSELEKEVYRLKQREKVLEQQLTEKDKEIEDYQKLINDICNKNRVGSLKELDEILQATTESLYASREYLDALKSKTWGLEKQVKNHNHEKIELLEKVKTLIREREKVWFVYEYKDIETMCEEIDTLISEIKGTQQ